MLNLMLSRRNLIVFGLFACALLIAGNAALFWTHAEVIERGYEDVSCRRFLSDGLIGTAIPNCDGTRDPGTGPVPIHFNSAGYRDSEHTEAPAPGVFRVALLGASIHVAPGLPEDANPARLIEARLAELGIPRVEVLNLSTEGFATIHHLTSLPRYLAYRPQLVIVDTIDGYKAFRDLWLKAFQNPAVPLGGARPFFAPSELLPAGFKWITGHRTLLRLFLHLKQVSEELRATRELARDPPGSAEQAGHLLSRSLEILGEMRKQCGRAGADLAVVWEGQPLTNAIALRQNEPSLLVHLYGPLFAPISVPPAAGLEALKRSGQLVADISAGAPSPSEKKFFLGGSYYYSRAGMEAYSRALADAIAPLIRKRLARPVSSAIR